MSLALESPWALLSLALPWLAWRFIPAAPRAPRPALKVPFFDAVDTTGEASDNDAAPRLPLGLIAWLCVLLAAARPVWHAASSDVVLAPYLLAAALILSVVLARAIAREPEGEP